MALLRLAKDEKLFEFIKNEQYKHFKSIILTKAIQAGKTSVMLETAEALYPESGIVCILDKNSPLAFQTFDRAEKLGWKVITYEPGMKIAKTIKEGFGKKQILCFLMEINNLRTLIAYLEETSRAITLFVDEGDKSRNTIDAGVQDEEEDEDGEVIKEKRASKEEMPPISKLIMVAKNEVKRLGGKTIFISATPMGILTSEKDDWLVVMQDPYLNYTGVWDNHSANVRINAALPNNKCKVSERWTGTSQDRWSNTWRNPVQRSCKAFSESKNHEPHIKQIMLISLEQRNAQQELMGRECAMVMKELGVNIPIVVFNGETKDADTTLAHVISQQRSNKIVVIAGFCASRGVSFTDFSNKNNQFELIIQVHASKKQQPLNSITQAMRIFGPARKTVNTALLICNEDLEEDVRVNMLESYRIVRELAEGNLNVRRGQLNPKRKLTQNYNYRYLVQRERLSNYYSYDDLLIEESSNPEDHLPFISESVLC